MEKDDGKKGSHDNAFPSIVFKILRVLKEAGKQVNPEGGIKIEVLDLTKDKKEY